MTQRIDIMLVPEAAIWGCAAIFADINERNMDYKVSFGIDNQVESKFGLKPMSYNLFQMNYGLCSGLTR